MANSLIDDMFAENSQFSGNGGIKSPKNGSKKIILFLLGIIILVGIVVAVFLVVGSKGKNNTVSAKAQFIKYIAQDSMSGVTDMAGIKGAFESLALKSNTTKTTINIDSNMPEMDLLTGFVLNAETEYDSNNHRGLIDLNLEYMDNPIFNMQTLITGQKAAMKSDEIVTRYVGYKLENIMNIYEDFYASDEMESQVNTIADSIIEIIKRIDYNFIFENISAEFLHNEVVKYSQVLNTIDESKFSQKEVTLERDTGNVATTAYIVKLNGKDLNSLLSAMLEELKNDTELMSILITALEPTGVTIDEEMIKLFVDELINASYELEGDESLIYTFTIYVSNEQVIKMTLDNEWAAIEIDYELYGENEVVNFTILDKELNVGIRIKLEKGSYDISELFIASLAVIQDNEVITELVFDFRVEGIYSETEMKMQLSISYVDTENNFMISGNTKVKFEDVEIDDLTNDNCLFLDELNEDERKIVIDSIKDRVQEIFRAKSEQVTLVNSNINSSIIEGIEPDRTEEIERAAAKDKIINAVASEMYEAEQNGEEYTVNNVADLEIEDAEEFSVTVENEIATVVLDGYKFEINAKFELVEVLEETEEESEE